MLRRDEPAMLVVCPPCGPFSSWTNVNIEHMSEDEIQGAMLTNHNDYHLDLINFILIGLGPDTRVGDLRVKNKVELKEKLLKQG